MKTTARRDSQAIIQNNSFDIIHNFPYIQIYLLKTAPMNSDKPNQQ